MARKNYQIIDRQGRLVDDDEGTDERGLLRDGYSLRVPMQMRDADSLSDVQRAVAMDKVARRFDDTLCRHQVGPVVVDRSEAKAAYEDSVRELSEAWRGPSAPAAAVSQSPVAMKIPTTDADFARLRQIRRAAYEDAKRELADARKTPSAPADTAPPCRDAAPPPRTMDAATARRIKQEAYDAMVADMTSAWKGPTR